MLTNKEQKHKEILGIKEWIKHTWNVELQLEQMTYNEVKKFLGEIDLDSSSNKKTFKRDDYKTKRYNRVCGKCEKTHVMIRKNGVRPRSGHLCKPCIRQSAIDRGKMASDKSRAASKKHKDEIGKQKLKKILQSRKAFSRGAPLRKINYKETKKLGEELGMNILNTKSFKAGFATDTEQLKKYTRFCRKCKESYIAVRGFKKGRPTYKGICPKCKIEMYKTKQTNIKNKSKKKWEDKIINLLKKEKRKLSVLEVCKKLKCSGSPIRKYFKILSEEGKIKLSKKPLNAEIVTTV